jgi:hypothetical protein
MVVATLVSTNCNHSDMVDIVSTCGTYTYIYPLATGLL